jgi:hypothetical protein
MSPELRQYGKRAKSDRFIQVISDASKSTVDGIRRVCRGDMKPPGRLRGSLTKFVLISNGFLGTKDQF